MYFPFGFNLKTLSDNFVCKSYLVMVFNVNYFLIFIFYRVKLFACRNMFVYIFFRVLQDVHLQFSLIYTFVSSCAHSGHIRTMKIKKVGFCLQAFELRLEWEASVFYKLDSLIHSNAILAW
ncbi:hypothetical protein TorRG33x02_180740, partial [Trema orientale]